MTPRFIAQARPVCRGFFGHHGPQRAEESLLESRRLYEELVASVPLGVYRFASRYDAGLVFEYVSERFCEIRASPGRDAGQFQCDGSHHPARGAGGV